MALFDVDQRLELFLRERGAAYLEFNQEVREPSVIVVAPFKALWRRPEKFQTFLRLSKWVEGGCTAIVLGLPENGPGLTAAHIQADAG